MTVFSNPNTGLIIMFQAPFLWWSVGYHFFWSLQLFLAEPLLVNLIDKIQIFNCDLCTPTGTASWLTFINLHKNINDKVSKVQYIKYIDIWFMTSTIFIFLSLLEFALVNSIVRGRYPISSRIFKKIQELYKKQKERNIVKGMNHLSNVTRSELDYANAILIDRIARVMFPLSWFSFELVYFFYLMPNWGTPNI